MDRFKNRSAPSKNKHVIFDDDGNVVAPPALEKTKEFLESEKIEDSGEEDEADEEFLTADELRTEEEEDFHDTHEQASTSVEFIEVQF